jgi:hypothetical protein
MRIFHEKPVIRGLLTAVSTLLSDFDQQKSISYNNQCISREHLYPINENDTVATGSLIW